MFDGDTATDQKQARALSENLADNLSRLFERFDPLLKEGAAALSPETEAELRAMAGIFDLDAEGAPAEVWSRLRPVLSRAGPAQRPTRVAPIETELTLMVVEDDPETAADLVDTLTDAGHRVVGPFHSAEAALAAAALHPVDVALLDINLSGAQTGIDLARSLTSAWGVPVLFLSGDVTAAAQNAELASALIIKPYTAREVLEAVSAVVVAR
jgi:CheY-like chemotaxis protein